MPQNTTAIDDSSPQIAYFGQWSPAGVAEEHNHTTHGSWTKGSQATISFRGTSIEVYGTIGREHNNGDPAFSPVTTYMIDGNQASASTFTGTPGSGILFRQLFYQSSTLDNGEHNLVVTLTNSNMNAVWLDYFQVERSTPAVATGTIAGAVVGGVVGLLLVITIGILLLRISRLRRKIQYEKVPRKANQTYWPWMSRPPGEVTPFVSDPFAETQPLSAPRPFSLQYPPHTQHTAHSSTYLDAGHRTSLSGYTTRGDTFADKLTTTTSRDSNATGHTSLSGYTTRGGTFADKTPSSTSATTSRHSNVTGHTSHTSYSGYTVQGGTQADKASHRSQPSSSSAITVISRNDRDYPPLTDDDLDLRPRPFLGTVVTNRMVADGEEAPPAYADPRRVG
ncbi:hypothetical protein DXG01_011087 [Tephrocybe rancida]|nr:hypothetical protein DXG01_011087 [Tephrocybe rancida]